MNKDMLRENRLFISFILLGILTCSPNKTEILFVPYVGQIIGLYLTDNEELCPSHNVIILSIEDINENEFVLNIISEMVENVPINFNDNNETVCFGHYQQFKIFIVGNCQRVLKGKCNEYEIIKNKALIVNAPISYDGPLWTLKIRDNKILDFSYKFCRPDTNLIEQLKLI